jgi:hypothetical protein
MNRAALLIAVVASALFAVTRGVQPAFACSGLPTWQQMGLADSVFEGRAISARHLPEQDDVSYRVFEVVVHVEVAHSNSQVGQDVVARARVPNPEIPQMCAQFESSEAFVGRFLVAAVHADDDGALHLDRSSTPFIADEPAGSDYDVAKAMARLAARTDPNAPVLDAEPANPGCGDLVAIVGERFPSNSDIKLTYPGQPGGVGRPFVLHTTADGMFGAKVLISESACGNQFGFVEAWAGSSTPYGDATLPLAIFHLPVREAGPAAPDAGTGLAMIARDRELPWNDVVMVVILVLAFSGARSLSSARRGGGRSGRFGRGQLRRFRALPRSCGCAILPV